ncbi:MAG: hypothetical protein M3N95_06120 [Actinomycetota bacterium]|nr:hypothetical protein [Actinomycetota bacterium]
MTQRLTATDRTPDSRTPRALMTRRMSALLLAAGLITAVAACSSNAKSGSSPTTTGTAPTASASSSAAGASIGNAADIAAIKSAYIAFFDPKTDLQKSLSLLQDGADFKTAVVSQGNSSYAQQASVSVSKVVVTSADKATVTFSVLLNKSPVLPNQTGYSVRQGGVWKVAGATFCGLLAAQGTPPPACSKPAATSLPG